MFRRLPQLVAALFLVSSVARAASLDAEMKSVEKLRGLTFAHAVVSKTITREELPKVLRALQLVDGGKTDLVGSMLALYESQVLAFYDPLTHTYFAIDKLPPAVAGMGESDMLRESVVIHELTHALQDQRFRAGARDLAL